MEVEVASNGSEESWWRPADKMAGLAEDEKEEVACSGGIERW